MDEASLIFYHIVNDNSERKKEERRLREYTETTTAELRIKKKPNKIFTAIKYMIQGVGAIIVGIGTFLMMGLLVLVV